MTLTAIDVIRARAVHDISRRRLLAFAVPLGVLAYLAYVFVAFDMGGLWQRMRWDHMSTFVSDSYSYKTHVTRNNRSGDVVVSIEGERKGTYAPGRLPGWVQQSGNETRVDLGAGHVVTFAGDRVLIDTPEDSIEAWHDGSEVRIDRNASALPGWIDYAPTRLDVTMPGGRVSLTRARTEVFRYFPGWEMFFFTLESPYYGHGLLDLLTGPRLDPQRSNLRGMWHDFWQNPVWRHGEVLWAMGETVLMAFLGTFGAAIVSLPLAFLAARNFAPLVALRALVRRVFDFARGVDGLIWTILLSRAFGPGPLTGSLAILLTDTGSFGKLFSEALENVDPRQIEGVQSTGANAAQRYRFGVIPQVMPVLLSQVFYYFESNTRSATIIGAITGGGIGLLLTQAIQTQKDWEEVTYYVILIILMVFAMDALSGWIRRRLIRG